VAAVSSFQHHLPPDTCSVQITQFVIRSFTIVERNQVDTDELDPESFHSCSEIMEHAHASLSPIQVGEDNGEPVYLGLGWPEEMKGIKAKPASQPLIGEFFAQMHEPAGTVFYLMFQGSGPVYVVLPAEQEHPAEASDEAQDRGASVDEVLGTLRVVNGGDLHERMGRFDRMWGEVLASLPAVLRFGPDDWGEDWDEFSTYVAAAILLDI
jgi:hypothetical protein